MTFSLYSKLSSSVSATLISAPGPKHLSSFIMFCTLIRSVVITTHPVFTPLVLFQSSVYVLTKDAQGWNRGIIADNVLFCVVNKLLCLFVFLG